MLNSLAAPSLLGEITAISKLEGRVGDEREKDVDRQ
jgi:hypothetical protein